MEHIKDPLLTEKSSLWDFLIVNDTPNTFLLILNQHKKCFIKNPQNKQTNNGSHFDNWAYKIFVFMFGMPMFVY